uniref:Putative tick transposon n=1 Tax=Rhipicephalus microplus TaxID=6941 RepID=A0A6G5A9V6_RHIMP
MEKAYDTTWRFGILRDLSHIGIHGNMFSVIESYLSDRTFRVRVSNVLSRTFVQETGVPQGGVLSCTLFIIKMNSLRLYIPRNIFYSTYVDDVQIGFQSCSLGICERQVQLALNKVSKWADENGFKLNPQKSTCVLFSRKRGLHPDPELVVKGERLPVNTEHKFLGIILDAKLTFVPHIKHLKNKCLKTMNILKVLSRTTWGSDRKCLMNLYRSLIRSRLEYGAIVYHSATPSALKMLDPVHHQGIRLSTGAFRTSPVESLYVESDEWSLHLQRTYSSFIYFLKVNANSEQPAYSTINDLSSSQLFYNRPAMARPFSLRVRDLAEETDVPLLEYHLSPPLCGSRHGSGRL